MTEPEILDYLNSLQVGDRVIETGKNCMLGCTGTVYKNERGYDCVLWDGPERMGTSVTWGTRRISDVESVQGGT